MNEKKKLVKQDKMVTDVFKKKKTVLNDAELEDVSGGYVDTAGWAEGYVITCPNCRESRENMFYTWIDDDYFQLDGYTCRNCGLTFGVDSLGYVWL